MNIETIIELNKTLPEGPGQEGCVEIGDVKVFVDAERTIFSESGASDREAYQKIIHEISSYRRILEDIQTELEGILQGRKKSL